jgi:hypothetical protein
MLGVDSCASVAASSAVRRGLCRSYRCGFSDTLGAGVPTGCVVVIKAVLDVLDHTFGLVLCGPESLLRLVPKVLSLVLQLIQKTHAGDPSCVNCPTSGCAGWHHPRAVTAMIDRRGPGGSAIVGELYGEVQVSGFDQCLDSLKIIAALAADAEFVTLIWALHS